MSGKFAAAIEGIAIRSAGNGGPTQADLLEAIVAGHDESVETAAALEKKTEETAAELATQLARIVSHLESEAGHTTKAIGRLSEQVGGRAEAIEAAKREVIAEIESRESWPVLDRVAAELRQCIEEHLRAAPRRSTDPETADWFAHRGGAAPEETADRRTLTEVLLGYNALKWAVRAVIAALIVFGVTYWADSCSRANYWGSEPPIVAPTPTPTSAP